MRRLPPPGSRRVNASDEFHGNPKLATLHFICGKAGSGKTTLARELGRTLPAAVFVEDEWIDTLGFEVKSLQDFGVASAKVRKLIARLAGDLLRLDVNVVFDFAGNTRNHRKWVRGVFEGAGADHVLHVIEATDEQCLANIHRRNEEKLEGIYAGYVSDETFHAVTAHFQPPQEDEGFRVQVRQ
jgi:predicted kinase